MLKVEQDGHGLPHHLVTPVVIDSGWNAAVGCDLEEFGRLVSKVYVFGLIGEAQLVEQSGHLVLGKKGIEVSTSDADGRQCGKEQGKPAFQPFGPPALVHRVN